MDLKLIEIGGNMKKIKMSIFAVLIAFTFGACTTVQFSGAAEGPEAGTYYLTAKPLANKEGTAAHQVFKCRASSELVWDCNEVAVNVKK
jgi:hypothetical protein